MRSFFGLMATLAVLWLGLSIEAAMARVLDEQTANSPDYFLDSSSLYASMIQQRSYQVDSSIEAFNSVHGIKSSVNFHNNQFKAPLTDKINFTLGSSNEFAVLVSNLDITTTSAPNLNPKPLYINSDKNNLTSTSNPMPEPETYSML